jgi:hypothetical protein
MSHFQASVSDLFDYALRDSEDSDIVGITITNTENIEDKAIGLSFRRKDHLSEELLWSVFDKLTQSNARLGALDKLRMAVHSVKMPVGFGKNAIKTKCRPLSVMAHLKKSIVEVRAEQNCLAHVLIITIARLTNDPNYKAYRHGRKILPVVKNLLETTGIDLQNGGGSHNIFNFRIFSKIILLLFMEV